MKNNKVDLPNEIQLWLTAKRKWLPIHFRNAKVGLRQMNIDSQDTLSKYRLQGDISGFYKPISKILNSTKNEQ